MGNMGLQSLQSLSIFSIRSYKYVRVVLLFDFGPEIGRTDANASVNTLLLYH